MFGITRAFGATVSGSEGLCVELPWLDAVEISATRGFLATYIQELKAFSCKSDKHMYAMYDNVCHVMYGNVLLCNGM